MWAVAGLACFSLAMLAVLSFELQSGRFHTYLLNRMQKEASVKLGTQVQLQNFSVHLASLTADLDGLKIQGASQQVSPPLLQVEHIGFGVRVVSILHRKWYLDRLTIDRPVLQIVTDDHGQSNVPHGSSGGNSSLNLFELGVRHVVLHRGAFYFDNKSNALEADLHSLSLSSRFDVARQQYSVVLGYRDGHVRVGKFQPIPHEMQAAFTATPYVIRLTSAKLVSGPSHIAMTGNVTDYQHPQIAAKYEAALSGIELCKILNNPSIPAGVVHTTGSLSYRQTDSRPLLDVLAINGEIDSRLLKFSTQHVDTRIGDISARYSLSDGNASLQNLQARLLGGRLSVDASWRNLTGDTQSKLTASLHGLSLAAAQKLMPASAATRKLLVRGMANGEVSAAWGKTLGNLVLHVDARLHGSLARVQGAKNVALESEFHGTYDAAGNQITVAHSYLKMPQTKLVMNGDLGRYSNLAFQIHSDDLSELGSIAAVLYPSSKSSTAQLLGMDGTATFQGTIKGALTNPHVAGRLVASNVDFKGVKFPTIQSDIDLDSSYASLRHSHVEISSNSLQHVSPSHSSNAAVAHIQFDGNAGLSRWAFAKASPIQLQLHASQLNIAMLAKLADVQSPVDGTMAADINLHGAVQNPIGRGTIKISRAKAFEEPIQSVRITFAGTQDSVHGDVLAESPAGVVHGAVTYHPLEQSYDLKLNADNIRLEKLHTLQAKNIDAKGLLTLDAAGQGTVKNPGLTATLQIPQLEIQNQKIANVHLGMNVEKHVLTAELDSQAIDTSIKARATVNLSGNYMADAALDTQPIALAPLLALYAPTVEPGLSGQTEVHATLSGPLKRRDLVTAHIALPVLHMAYGKNIQLAAISPVHVDYSKGVLALQRTTIQGTETNLQLQGSFPVYGNQPVSVLLLGTVNLQLVQLFNPEVRSSGNLIFNINSYGTRRDPNVEGEIAIVNANFSNGSLPVGLQHGNGILSLTKDRLNIKSFQGEVGGGTLTAQGGISYRPTIQFDLGASAKNIRMLYPQGLREELSADLRLAGNEKNALLGGAVKVADVSFTPAFDLTSFIGGLSSGVAPPPTPGFSQNLHLNLAVNSTSGVSLVSRTLSLNGTANLQVRGTAAEPVILGRINLNDGDVIFNGNRFVLSGGTVAFVNPTETQPVVNLTLNTTIQQYNIHLRFNGPVDQLRTNYASDPSLPSADIINLLAFGQTTEANAANAAAPADQAAEGLLASQVSSQITNRVSKVAGISQLSINPVLAGGSTQGPAGAIVTVQQRVTGNFFVTYSTNVATTQDQIIMGQYQLSPKVAVTGTRDQNGGFAFDTIFKKSW